MTDVYVIRNQHGHYWGKGKVWVSGEEARAVMRAHHQDEAVNTLFELSAKDVDLRGSVAAVPLSDRDEPVVEPSRVPLPAVEESAAEPGTPDAVQSAAETN